MSTEQKTVSTSNDILIVEDNKIIQNMIQKSLLLTEYKAHVSRNGAQAIKMIEEKKGPFKAILLDLLMPIVDGVKVIKHVRGLSGEKSKTVIIAVTGNHEEYTAEQFRAMGFNAVIIKPIISNEVITTLERSTDPKADDWLGIVNQ